MDVVERAKNVLIDITPGPWRADHHEDTDHDRITVGAGTYLASPGHYTSTDLIHEVYTHSIELDSKDYAQISADALFIAAAPALVHDLIAEVEHLCQNTRLGTAGVFRAFGRDCLENGDITPGAKRALDSIADLYGES